MKRYLVTLAAAFVCFSFLLPACSFQRQAVKRSGKHTLFVSKFDETYFNFTRSQLELNKGNVDRAIHYMEQAIQGDPDSLYLKRELAYLYIEKEDYDRVLNIFNAIVQEDPENLEALVMLGKIQQTQKSFEQAKSTYQKIIDLDPKQHDIYLLLGGLYIEENNPEKALDIFNRMAAHFPDSYTAYFFLGKINAEMGNFAKAEKYFYKTLKLRPDLVESKFELADLFQMEKFTTYTVTPGDTLKSIATKHYSKFNPQIEAAVLNLNPELDDPDDLKPGQIIRLPNSPSSSKRRTLSARKKNQIIRLYKEILKADPQNIRAKMGLAYFYKKMKMSTAADKIFNELGKTNADDMGIIVEIVNRYLEKKKFEEAGVITEGILKSVPQRSDLHHIAGLAYEGMKDDEAALRHFMKVEPGSRFYEDAVVHISYIYQQNEKIQEAISYLEGIVEQYPDNEEFMLFLGTLYEDLESYEKAEEIFKKGIALDKDNVKLHFRLGVTYDKWDKKEKCIKQMKQVIRLDPKHANALNYLGYTYAEMGKNLDEAERLVKEAMKVKPNDGYITDSLGWVYYKKGLYEKALEFLEKAVSLVPDDPTMLEHLGDAHLQLGNKSDALKFYKMSLDKKGEKEKSKETLEKKINDLKDQGF